MKKTIITLLALAGVSMGDTVSEYTSTYTATDWSDGTLTLGQELDLSLDYWSLEATITLNDTRASAVYGTRIFYSSNAENPGVNNFFLWHGSTSGQSTNLNVIKFRGFGLQTGEADHLVKSVTTDDVLKYGTGTYTFNFTRDGETLTLSVYDSEANLLGSSEATVSTVSMTGTISALKTDLNSDLLNLGYTMPEVTISTAKPIPEPASATLSLLALAGLAARRRRR